MHSTFYDRHMQISICHKKYLPSLHRILFLFWHNYWSTNQQTKYTEHSKDDCRLDYTNNIVIIVGQCGLAPTVCDPVVNRVRMIDGQCNDFDNPASGSVYYRFGQYMNVKAKLFSALFANIGNVMAKRSI